MSQVLWYGVEYGLANIDKGDEQEHYAFNEHYSERLLPRVAHCLAERVGEESVEAHARSLGERQLGHESEQRGYGGGYCRGGEQRATIHPGRAENGGVHGEYIAHGKKSGGTSHHFRTFAHGLRVKTKKLLQYHAFLQMLL